MCAVKPCKVALLQGYTTAFNPLPDSTRNTNKNAIGHDASVRRTAHLGGAGREGLGRALTVTEAAVVHRQHMRPDLFHIPPHLRHLEPTPHLSHASDLF
eukprot:1870164-Rhodomonas_salina.2